MRSPLGALARGIVGAGVVLLVNAGTVFLSHLVLARTAGRDAYGGFSVALSWIVLAVIPAQLGLSNEVVRSVAHARAIEDWGEWRGIQRFSGQSVLLFGLLVGLLTALLFHRFAFEGGGSVPMSIAVGCSIPLLAFSAVRQAALRGNRRVITAGVGQLFPSLLVLLVFGLVPIGASAVIALLVYCLGGLVGVLWLDAVTSRSWTQFPHGPAPARRAKSWLKAAMPLLLVQGLAVIQQTTDVMLLGAVCGPASAGPYSACVKISNLAALGLTVCAAVFPALASELWAKNERDLLQRLLTRTALVTSGVTVVFGALAASLAPFLLSLFGDGFAKASLPLRILVAGQVVNALSGPVGLFLITLERRRVIAVTMAASAAVNVLLNVLLIPLWGQAGAAIATAAAMVLWNIALIAYVRASLGFRTTALGI